MTDFIDGRGNIITEDAFRILTEQRGPILLENRETFPDIDVNLRTTSDGDTRITAGGALRITNGLITG